MSANRNEQLAYGVSRLEAAIARFQEGTAPSDATRFAREAEEVFAQLLEEHGVESSLDGYVRATEAIHRHLFPKSEPDPERIRRRVTNGSGSKLWEDAEDVLVRAISNYWRLVHSLTPPMEEFERPRAGGIRLRCVGGPWDGRFLKDPESASYPYPNTAQPTAYYNVRDLRRGEHTERVLIYEDQPATGALGQSL